MNCQIFDGATYVPKRDSSRLFAQLERVRNLMLDGQWRTLAGIADTTHDPETSVSARLRDLRKARFGSYTVERKYAGSGLFFYRVAGGESHPA